MTTAVVSDGMVTVQEIAQATGLKFSRLNYVLLAKRIDADRRVGNTRLYTPAKAALIIAEARQGRRERSR